MCNIATQTGESDTYSCDDHVRALEEHIGEDLFDVVLCNDNHAGQLNEESQWVRVDEKTLADSRVRCGDLVDDGHPWRHDPVKLASVLVEILDEYTGPLS